MKTETVQIIDMQAGKAGEYLVCADLIIKGYIAYPSEQGLSYDVVADVGNKLIRVQVKTTRGEKFTPQRAQEIPTYIFHMKRMGKGGRKVYRENDVDIFAFVSLKNKKIGYVPAKDCPTTFILRDRDFEVAYDKVNNRGIPIKAGRYIDDYSFEKAIKTL